MKPLRNIVQRISTFQSIPDEEFSINREAKQNLKKT